MYYAVGPNSEIIHKNPIFDNRYIEIFHTLKL